MQAMTVIICLNGLQKPLNGCLGGEGRNFDRFGQVLQI